MADNFEFDALVKKREDLERLMMKNPSMEKKVQKIIRKVLTEVRKAVMAAAQQPSVMKTDPRQAYKAVKMAVYRQILGGNVSILNRKKGVQFSAYEPPKKLQPKQRGGNRKKRSDRTQDLLTYSGPDRGFVLRFLNAGTNNRFIRNFAYNDNRKMNKWNKHPNTGFRGRIAARNFFSTSSQQAMQAAANNLTNYINELIKQEFN